MKKIIVISIVVLLVCAAFSVSKLALAAPGDVSIELVIPKAWIDENLPAILRVKPISQMDDPSDPNDNAPMINEITPEQHIKNLIKQYLYSIANKGHRMLAADAATKAKDEIQ